MAKEHFDIHVVWTMSGGPVSAFLAERDARREMHRISSTEGKTAGTIPVPCFDVEAAYIRERRLLPRLFGRGFDTLWGREKGKIEAGEETYRRSRDG